MEVSSDSMDVAIESAYCGPEINSCNFGLGQRCVESMVEYDKRQSIVSKCDTEPRRIVQDVVGDWKQSHTYYGLGKRIPTPLLSL